MLSPSKLLTVVLNYDHSVDSVDADIEKARHGELIIVNTTSENYVNQLRLRIEQEPSLAELVDVYWKKKDGAIVKVSGLNEQQQQHWPPSFMEQSWDIESQISDLRLAKR